MSIKPISAARPTQTPVALVAKAVFTPTPIFCSEEWAKASSGAYVCFHGEWHMDDITESEFASTCRDRGNCLSDHGEEYSTRFGKAVSSPTVYNTPVVTVVYVTMEAPKYRGDSDSGFSTNWGKIGRVAGSVGGLFVLLMASPFLAAFIGGVFAFFRKTGKYTRVHKATSQYGWGVEWYERLTRWEALWSGIEPDSRPPLGGPKNFSTSAKQWAWVINLLIISAVIGGLLTLVLVAW